MRKATYTLLAATAILCLSSACASKRSSHFKEIQAKEITGLEDSIVAQPEVEEVMDYLIPPPYSGLIGEADSTVTTIRQWQEMNGLGVLDLVNKKTIVLVFDQNGYQIGHTELMNERVIIKEQVEYNEYGLKTKIEGNRKRKGQEDVMTLVSQDGYKLRWMMPGGFYFDETIDPKLRTRTMITTYDKDPNPEESAKSVTTIDDKGNVVYQWFYSRIANTFTETEHQYDDRNLLAETIKVTKSPTTKEVIDVEHISYTYTKFDEVGNWTEREEKSEKSRETHIRKIYYRK